METDTTETHYTASRFPLTIRVTIAGDQVHWLYRYGANTWREQLPLAILVPYPTRCIHGNDRPRRLEWAVFDSIFPQKTVYFFCGPDREAFEQFAAELQNRILAARSPCV